MVAVEPLGDVRVLKVSPESFFSRSEAAEESEVGAFEPPRDSTHFSRFICFTADLLAKRAVEC